MSVKIVSTEYIQVYACYYCIILVLEQYYDQPYYTHSKCRMERSWSMPTQNFMAMYAMILPLFNNSLNDTPIKILVGTKPVVL